jgi:Predicted pyridoxal phosphate-dependent enzyme apparently involved in regulation of cell wall biogenesis
MTNTTLKILQANPRAENDLLSDEIFSAISRVLQNGQYIQGPEVSAFEAEFAEYVGARYGIGVASGTDALHLGLRALGVESGDEVITVSHTAVATVAAIEQSGAKPVFVDVDPELYTMDPNKLEAAITPRTRVIIPVHIYGNPADLNRISDIARNHDVDLLEDCAQAHGASYAGRIVGTWGKLAAFSFYPTKNLGAVGDGGMVVTNDEDLAERVRLLREYGWKKRYVSEVPGFNSRLDELQAAILRVKLKYLGQFNEFRRNLATRYTTLLSDHITPPKELPGAQHVYHLYVIRTSQREGLQNFLINHGIGTGIHYPRPIHLQPAYSRMAVIPLPVTEQIAKEILSLPLYPQMEMDQVEEVAILIKDYFRVMGK